MTNPQRSATINIEQQANGYWLGTLVVHVPGMPEQEFRNELAHDAGEVLDWARWTLQATVAALSSPGWLP